MSVDDFSLGEHVNICVNQADVVGYFEGVIVNATYSFAQDVFSVYVKEIDRTVEIDSAHVSKSLRAKKNTESALALLDKAAHHMKDRAATYDKPEGERSMGATVKAFNAITGKSLCETEGWLFMQILKDVRLFQNREVVSEDSATDCIAYSALKGECVMKRGFDE